MNQKKDEPADPKLEAEIQKHEKTIDAYIERHAHVTHTGPNRAERRKKRK